MLIVCASIQSYKRVRDVEIRPESDCNLLLIAGNNAEGKTSIMDAIDAIIGGKRAIAPDPVHHGDVEARIAITWDNGLTAERTIAVDGSTTLKLKDATRQLTSPQAVITKLLGQRTLDPLEFTRNSALEQRAKLLEIIDKDKQIPAMDAQRSKIYDVRTEVGRKLKDAEGELQRLPDAVEVAAITDVAALSSERAQLAALQQEGAKAAARHQVAARDLEQSVAEERHRAQRILDIEEELQDARAVHAKAIEITASTRTIADETSAAVDAAVHAWNATAERRAEVDAELANANAHNRAVVEGEQLNARRAAAQKMVDDRRKEYTEGTKLIDKIDAKKLAFLAAASLPVPGLGIEAECVTLNGAPLEQASGAEKLRVALGIAIAAQSEIKDILIRDASLLDDASLLMVEEVAAAAGCRAWLERVGTRDPGAIVIRDGQVAP